MSETAIRGRNVTAVLGPTNTGKTHLAIERMLGHETGMIGLPLRLLAREVYDKIAARVGAGACALITGEEKIKPEGARYWVSTVEAMPREISADFLAIDEIQLAADPERGHVFTDRLLNARGRLETLLLGAGTMREAVIDLVPGANFISRPRLSKLGYAGQKKITRLPKRSAIVAFSANDVYQIAELIRRQLGGAAVVLGALSPRTRNAQVALYQSGDVDYIVATDAVGMGLNLDVDHVAFAAIRKFDGQNHRNLTPGELGQIAGRAGRHLNDGTFGVTADVEPLEADLIERLETHTFDTIKTLQWRNRDLDLGSVDALRDSLRRVPRSERLIRARMADDVLALEAVSADREITDLASGRAAVEQLWEVCQIPDYRKISSQNHAEMVGTLYKFIAGPEQRIPEDWFSKQVAFADRTDGDIDTLANRIAHIRTWTFVSNRPGWLKDPGHWQERTRAIEDSLSDALHECLTQRFVDRRTSALMKGLRDKEELAADIKDDGQIHVESHFVGRIKGFRFAAEALADTSVHGKAMRQAAGQVVAKEMAMRARRVAAAKIDAFKLTRSGRILWREEEIGRLEAGESPLRPQVVLLTDEHLAPPDKEKVQERLNTWIVELIGERLKPLVEISEAADVSGLAKGIAFQLVEQLGILKRDAVANEIKSLDQPARGQLRKYGVRFGAFSIHFPLLLKPAASELRLALWALRGAQAAGLDRDSLPEPPRPGLTSAAADPKIPEAYYRATGYHLAGPRAVRIDILERLADQIRPLIAWRPAAGATPPKGATGDGGFKATPEMLSILGCSLEELGGVLRTLGFRLERRPVRKPPPAEKPVEAPAAGEAPAGDTTAGVPSTEAAIEPAGDVPPAQDIAALLVEAAVAAVTAPTAKPAPASTAESPAGPSAVAPTADLAAAAAAPEGQTLPSSAGPPADAVAADAPHPVPGAEAVAATPAEPEMEEIWRPRRRGRGEHGERSPRPGRDDRRHRRGPPTQGQQPSSPATAGEAGDAAQPSAPTAHDAPGPARERERDGVDRRHRHDDRRKRSEQRDRRPPPKGDERRGGGRDRDRSGREDGGGERRGGRDRPTVVARSGPAPKTGGVDPDSPFAKLVALKQALEKQARE
jgi:ATP-dependent RNA helicase SUPV3L1/SUV3